MPDAFRCMDCGTVVAGSGVESQCYMVWPDLWERAGGGYDFEQDWLCVSCLEARIGRRLSPHDLLPMCGYNHDPEQIEASTPYLASLKREANAWWQDCPDAVIRRAVQLLMVHNWERINR